ncbi:MAG: PEP-CTERM sorting domain-containing protein [Bacteroidetes bacterium]|nr:PEP-CTERM sorting domain-containing protein [Bacteroidota bacterium]
MNKIKKGACTLFLVTLLSPWSQAASLQIVCDNDFAVFAGTVSSISRLIYQNGANWDSQIASAASFNLSLANDEDTIYLLAMGGGGGQENISGKINDVNLTSLTSIMQSNEVHPFLSGYDLNDVANGIYNAILVDLQNALTSLSWSTPTPLFNPSGEVAAVIEAAGFGSGFTFGDSTAVLYRFEASLVGIPEPSTLSLLAVGLGVLFRRSRRTV